jgi:hypothetical protein
MSVGLVVIVCINEEERIKEVKGFFFFFFTAKGFGI